MPENTPPDSAVPRPVPASPEAHPLPHLGDEFGTAKRNLPPVKIVAIAIAIVAVVLGAFAFLKRAKPQGSGSIEEIAAAEIPNQNAVLVAVNITVRNTGEKRLWIQSIKGVLKTGSAEFPDEAASAVDFERYFQAFPGLKEHALPALIPETKLAPGQEARGTVVVSFPVTKEVFDKRTELRVVIKPYDQVPVVLTK